MAKSVRDQVAKDTGWTPAAATDENSDRDGAPVASGHANLDERTRVYVAALLREREGYLRFAKKDRVKAVDAELARVGYETAAVSPVIETRGG